MKLSQAFHVIAFAFLALALAACGGSGGGGSRNSPPRFTSPTSFSFSENSPVGFNLTVEDPDGDAITIRVETSGDGAFFSANSTTGNIFANQVFNFENPQDSDQNNVYDVRVTLSDGRATTSQIISVTITDADDIPTCSYDGTATYIENTTGLVYTFDGDDEDGIGDYTGFTIWADPIHRDVPNAIYDSARLDTTTGELFFDLPIDREDPSFSADRVAFTTAYRQNGQLASCRVFVTIEDVPSVVTSGIKLRGQVSGADSVSDIDRDGIDELWLEGPRSYDLVQTQVEAYLIFGAALSYAIADTGAASLTIPELESGSAIRFFTTDVDVVSASGNGGGEQLIGRPMSDLDGDGIPELLIGHRTNSTHGRSVAPPAVYLIWGRTIVGNITGEIDLRNLSPSDGIVIRMEWDVLRRGLDVTSGDFDGDGIVDVVIGAPEPTYRGFSSRPHTFVIKGTTLLAARASGELDLANRNDIVIFSDTSTGMRQAGSYLMTIGDLDNDGRDDLLVASMVNQFAVIPGAVISTAQGGTPLPFWGHAIFLETSIYNGGNYAARQTGDIDNDGIPDVLIAYGNRQRRQTASIVSGSLLRSRIGDFDNPQIVLDDNGAGIISISSLGSVDLGGGRFVSVGDVDGDGINDVAFGQRMSQQGQPTSSSIFIMTGRAVNASGGQDFDLSAHRPGDILEVRLPAFSETAASAFTSLSDIDGDGIMEIVVVERLRDEAYVILGADISHALTSGETVLDTVNLFEFEPSAN